MNNIHKTAKAASAILLALSLVVSASIYTPAKADTLSDLKDKYQQLQSQQQELQKKLNGLSEKVSSATEKKKTIDANVDSINAQITVLNNEVTALNSEIEKTNTEISDTEKSIEKNTQIYKERICTIYETGKTSKIEILLSSKNITEFLTRMETLQIISDHDTKLISDLKADREKLDEQKKSLEEKHVELEKSKGTLDAKKQSVEIELAEQKEIVASLKSDAADISNTKSAVKAEQKKTDSQIQAEINRIAEERRKALAAQNHGEITVAADGNAILGYAEGYIGTPYKLGANNYPYAIDCSAFVMDVFAHFGITLHRCSANQVSDGTPISKADMKPCDLVFFDTEGDGVSHVGIYMGNGKFIAANSGAHESGVGIWDLNSSYWAPKFVCARRVIN